MNLIEQVELQLHSGNPRHHHVALIDSVGPQSVNAS